MMINQRRNAHIMENSIEEVQARKDKGFTLVELLIVIVILGILATVTVFAVRGITDKGKSAGCQADAKTFETGLEAYYAQNGLYPASAAVLVTPVAPDLVKYLKKIPANFTYAAVAASAGPPAVAASYTITGTTTCVGVNVTS